MTAAEKRHRAEIGARLKQARKAKGLTQRDVGDALGIDHSGLSRWETGSNAPSVHALMLLSDALGRSADWLLRGEQ